MARPKTLTRKIGKHTEAQMKEELKRLKSGESIRQVASNIGIPFTTLRRYSLKLINRTVENINLVPNYEVNKVFSQEQEEILNSYYKSCALMFYGLSTKECRKVAFQMATINNLKMPDSWKRNGIAGKEWLKLFRKRHPTLSLRRPEACSLARATAFNRANVNTFYNNLEKVMQRNPMFGNGTRIFNLDETSTTTVQRPQKVIAPKGCKGLGKVTSGEKGTLVTTCCIICSSGISLPPVMVFPRKNFKDHMLKITPPGTLGLAAPTGWMNSDIFPEVIKHFIKFTNSSLENPSILIMDNHESHLSIEALDLAKSSGIHILTLHPHTSGKLQPLDVGIFGPFKTYYNAAIDSWMLQHPGKPVTIYDVGEIAGIAFLKSMTPANILNAFKKCGIFPFDRNLFNDDDFMPSMVTDRPCPDCELRRDAGPSIEEQAWSLNALQDRSSYENQNEPQNTSEVGPSTTERINTSNTQPVCASLKKPIESLNCPQVGLSLEKQTDPLNVPQAGPSNDLKINQSNQEFVSPFQFRDPIKAGPRKNNRKPRKLGRSLIATDTPEKTEIQMEKTVTKKRKEVKKKRISKHLFQRDSEDDNDKMELQDNDDDFDCMDDEKENTTNVITENHLSKPLSRQATEGEYILVEFATKKKKLYYVGKVIENRNESLEYCVSFLRKKSTNKFYIPNVPDISTVDECYVKLILPKPRLNGSTTRRQSYFEFAVDLSLLNVQ